MIGFFFGKERRELPNMVNLQTFCFCASIVLALVIIAFQYPFANGRPFSTIRVLGIVADVIAASIVWILISSLVVIGATAEVLIRQSRSNFKRFATIITNLIYSLGIGFVKAIVRTIKGVLFSWLKIYSALLTWTHGANKTIAAFLTATFVFIGNCISQIKRTTANSTGLCNAFSGLESFLLCTIRTLEGIHLFEILKCYPSFGFTDRTSDKGALTIAPINKPFFVSNNPSIHTIIITGTLE